MTSGPRELSDREMEVARLIAEGLTDKEIAAILCISAWTVKSHLDRIAAKLEVNKARNRRIAITLHVERTENPPASPTALAS